MRLIGDARFRPQHRQNRAFFDRMNGLEIKQVDGPYQISLGEVFVPGGDVGEVFVPGGTLGQILADGG